MNRATREDLQQYRTLRGRVTAWQTALARLQRETGYDTVFLPALERLSPSYRRYREGLARADAAFRARFGEPEREKTDRK